MMKRKNRRMNKADQITLYEAYKQYKLVCKRKKQSKKQRAAAQKEIICRIDMLLLLFNGSSISQKEKSKAVLSGKKLYQQYCKFLYEKDVDPNSCMAEKIDRLLFQMAIVEAEQVASLRKQEVGGNRIDLVTIFQEQRIVKLLINMPINTLIKEAFKDLEFTCVSKMDQKIFITEYGSKYHREDCSYCKGRNLFQATFTQVENLGYHPCRCIESSSNVLLGKDEMSKTIKASEGTNAMTAFIDESFRDNPWKRWDDSLPEKQASYSYIICRGALEAEQEINEENEVNRNACLASENKGIIMAATEAIRVVMMEMAFQYNFRGNVIIYTDNMCAKDKWYTIESMLYLAALFESVKVCYIPRKENMIADGIGREQAFMQVPAKLMDEVVRKCQEYDTVCELVNFIKKRF